MGYEMAGCICSWWAASDPIVATLQRSGIVNLNEERKIVYFLELTAPWGSNLYVAEKRKELRYENLLTECKQKWLANHTHLRIGTRCYVDRRLLNLFRRKMGFTAIWSQATERMGSRSSRESLSNHLAEREDNTWLENITTIAWKRATIFICK